MFQDYLNNTANAGPLGFFFAFFGIILTFFIITYVFYAFVLMALAKKTKQDNIWMAWVPVANIILMLNIAELDWWYLLILLFAPIIPIIGGLASFAVGIYIWYKIAKRVNKPGWMGVLVNLPPIGFIFAAILAWSK